MKKLFLTLCCLVLLALPAYAQDNKIKAEATWEQTYNLEYISGWKLYIQYVEDIQTVAFTYDGISLSPFTREFTFSLPVSEGDWVTITAWMTAVNLTGIESAPSESIIVEFQAPCPVTVPPNLQHIFILLLSD